MSRKAHPHTHFRRGKRVIVTLTDGHRFVDKFIDRMNKYITLQEHGRIQTKDIRAITIYRGQQCP